MNNEGTIGVPIPVLQLLLNRYYRKFSITEITDLPKITNLFFL